MYMYKDHTLLTNMLNIAYLRPTSLFFLMIAHPPISTLFPYTTLFRSLNPLFTINVTMRDIKSKNVYSRVNSKATTQWTLQDRKTGSAGMPRPISYAVFCLKKKKRNNCELITISNAGVQHLHKLQRGDS